MEEVNLELESSSHKNVSIGSNNIHRSMSDSNINIFKNTEPPKESNIGIDLLINKSKTGSINESQEFKPSEPVMKTDSIENNNLNITLSDIGSSNTKPRESISSTPVTSINLNNETKQDDLNINLDDLFKDDTKPDTILENNISNNISSPAPILTPQKSFEELQKEKAEYLRLLERLDKKGINSHKQFNMNSDYNEVKAEFDRLTRQRECDQSIKFQRKMLIAFVTAVEFLNTKFDPFDVKLEGWSESVHENSGDYDDVFEELHEKYQSKSKMAPELKLLFMLGGSGFMFHLTNTMFKSSLPGMGDIMKQNPDLMKQFASAAANTMETNNRQQAASTGSPSPFSGLGNLMGGLMGGGGGGGLGGLGEMMGGLMGDSGGSLDTASRPEMKGPPDMDSLLNQLSDKNLGNSKNINLNM